MNFYSMRDLRTESKTMWADLDSGNEVVLTNNGKPAAIIIDIPEGYFDETVQAVRQAKAMIALNSIRQKAAKEGYMSDNDIDDIISEVRASSSAAGNTAAKREDNTKATAVK